MKNSPVLPYILLTCCALFWSGSSVVGRHVAGEIPPMALNFWRWFFAFLIVLFNLNADVLYGLLDPRIRYD